MQAKQKVFTKVSFLVFTILVITPLAIAGAKKPNIPETLVLAELSPREGRVTEVLDWLETILPETRAYDGCKSLSVYQEIDKNKIILVERWESKEKFIAYRNWRAETGALGALVEMLDADPVFRFSLDTEI